ncbi:MAG: hypothetical protein H7267_00525 [Sandarakinorhabdus sp.]|nr:hypothetical protein [Sandarakinorhabdus sp.]
MHIFTKRKFAAALIMLAFPVAIPTAASAAGIGHSFFMRGSVVRMENGTSTVCIGKTDGARVGQVLDVVRVTTGQGTKGVPAFRREDVGSPRKPVDGAALRCDRTPAWSHQTNGSTDISARWHEAASPDNPSGVADERARRSGSTLPRPAASVTALGRC